MTTSADSVPFLAGYTKLDTYDECQEVLVSSRLFEAGAFEEYSAPVWGGVLSISNGAHHVARRRHMGSLLSRKTLASLERSLFDHAVDVSLDECKRSSAAGETVRTDMVLLARLIATRIVGGMTGIDGVIEDQERARRLIADVDGFVSGTQVRWSTRPPEEVIPEALAAVEAFRTEFFVPSWERRKALVEAHLAANIPEDGLPDDLITRMLVPAGTELWTEEVALRDTLSFLAGGIGTTGVAITTALDLYLDWEGRDPSRESDPDFLRSVANETLRLYPPVPYIVREAMSDATLASGRTVQSGELFAILVEPANRDQAVFGADADVFRPDRYLELPAQYPQYGLAFGAGPHLCVGRPVATVGGVDPAETAVHRTIVHVLRAALAAGAEHDPDSPVTKEASFRDIFRTYPVVLTKLTGTGPAS